MLQELLNDDITNLGSGTKFLGFPDWTSRVLKLGFHQHHINEDFTSQQILAVEIAFYLPLGDYISRILRNENSQLINNGGVFYFKHGNEDTLDFSFSKSLETITLFWHWVFHIKSFNNFLNFGEIVLQEDWDFHGKSLVISEISILSVILKGRI